MVLNKENLKFRNKDETIRFETKTVRSFSVKEYFW